MHYEHTQNVPDKVLAVASIAGLAIGLTPPGFLARLLLCGIMGAAAYTFRSLTVVIDDYELRLEFGDGVIKKSFPLSEIANCKAVRTTPLQGWGIHWTGAGWLYNVYGLDAVELSLNNGKKAYIGTDEPDKLAAAVDGRLIIVH